MALVTPLAVLPLTATSLVLIGVALLTAGLWLAYLIR